MGRAESQSLSSHYVVFDVRGHLECGITVFAAKECDIDGIGEKNRSDSDPHSSHSKVVAALY
jgi:hypothetical protein